MKLGIVGSGMIVEEFLPGLCQIEGIEIVGIQGTPRSYEKVKKISELYHIPLATTDFNELCNSGIDTVYIAVPNHLHYDYSRRALERGLNVIVEKPITSNLREAEDLAAIAKKNCRFLFEAITTIYLPAFQKIREWLPQIGEVKLVQSQYTQYSSRYDAFCKGEVLPVFDPAKSGGTLMDLNIYNLFFVIGLFGKPESVDYYANIERGIDTSGIVMMKYPKFQALCLAGKDCKGNAGSMIQGTKGCIRAEGAPNYIGKIILELNDGTTEEMDGSPMNERQIQEFKTFARAIDQEDYDFCYEQLENSLIVSAVQSEARIKAGIRFDADFNMFQY